MQHLLWGSVTIVAFLLGWWLGRGDTGPPGEQTSGIDPGPALRAALTVPPAAGDSVRAPTWQERLGRHDRLVRQGDRGAAAALEAELLGEIRRLATAGEVERAEARLDEFLARNPHHGEAPLLAADLAQLRGRTRAALEPLLQLLGFADDPELIGRARDRLALLVNVLETQLANRGDLTGLVRLFEALSAGDPTFDGHRLRLTHWLLRAGRLDEADRVLAQTGSAGVDPQAREDLAATLALARGGLPLEPALDLAGRPRALHVQARAGGADLRLLVDTGATTTVLSRQRAAALGSRPTGRRVAVRTANGLVEAEQHRLGDVEVGALKLATLEVLVLDRPLPEGIDGLLGMDVIARFPGATGPGGLPFLP